MGPADTKALISFRACCASILLIMHRIASIADGESSVVFWCFGEVESNRSGGAGGLTTEAAIAQRQTNTADQENRKT